MGPRDFLNKLKWHPDFSLDQAEISILHRGAPRDRILVEGSDISELGSGFMRVERKNEEVRIPYHRILEIKAPTGEVIWKKALK